MRILPLVCFLGIAASSVVARALDDRFLDKLERELENAMRDEMKELEEWMKNFKDEVANSKTTTIREILMRIQEKYEEYKEKGMDLKLEFKKFAKEVVLQELHRNKAERKSNDPTTSDEMVELRKWMKQLEWEFDNAEITTLNELLDRVRNKIKEYKEKGIDITEEVDDFLRDMFPGHTEESSHEIPHKLYFEGRFEREFKEMVYRAANAIKNYIVKLKTDNPDLRDLQEVARKLDEDDIKELIDLIDKVMREEVRNGVSHGETWDKIKDYFKKVGLELKEKAKKLKEWIQEHLNKGLDKLKDKQEALKKIARELIDHAKEVKAEVAREALEFLRPYKKDLGDLWDQLIAGFKDALKKDE